MSKRITPEEVLAAYEATGLKPVQESWTDMVNGQRCGCGLTAVAMSKRKGLDFSDFFSNLGDLDAEDRMLAHELGLPLDYVWGFAAGFDGNSPFGIDYADWRLGYKDGRAAWEAVKHLA